MGKRVCYNGNLVRIISPFHDYYDTAQGLGYDPTLIYRRQVEEKVVRAETVDPVICELLSQLEWDSQYITRLVVLGFCGRAYPAYLPLTFVIDADSLTNRLNTSPVMTRDELDKLYAEEFGDVRETKWNRPYRKRRWDVLERQGTAVSLDTFRLLASPIWLAEVKEGIWRRPLTLHIYTNIRLANFDFQKHFDAYTAFQEIAMFLGSALATTDDSARTVGSDEVIARAKGFGPESFRSSAPSVKKSRRKENRARKKGEGSSEQG